MKKLLNWVLPAFLGIVPVLGMDDSAGEIKDSFFTKKDTAVSIRMVYESGQNVMAMVDATDSKETKSKKVITECAPDGWEMNDETRTYKEKVIAQIICGTEMLEQAYTKRLESGYIPLVELKGANFVGDILIANADLQPGTKATLHNLSRFERPNKTILETKGPVLQEIIAQIWYKDGPTTGEEFLKETEGTQAVVAKFVLEEGIIGKMIEELYPVIRTVDIGLTFNYNWCWKHQEETQAGFKKFGRKELRHAHRTYAATPTTPVIKKNTLNDKATNVFAGLTETLLTQLSQQDIGGGQKNEPSCTPNNHTNGLPAGYRVV
ncbi:MAG: hypothetical protein ACOH2E_00655 [Candidatus Paracaedibacter sp.]